MRRDDTLGMRGRARRVEDHGVVVGIDREGRGRGTGVPIARICWASAQRFPLPQGEGQGEGMRAPASTTARRQLFLPTGISNCR